MGLPCVDLSSLNASPAPIFGRNDGPPGSTASGFAALKRYVRKRRPKVVLLENSDRMYAKVQQNNFQPAIDNLTKFASKEGYRVVDSILNACHFGIPQNRPRCYMVWVLGEECRNSQPLTAEVFNQFMCHPVPLQSICWDSPSTFSVSQREWEGRHGEKWRQGFKEESSKLGEALYDQNIAYDGLCFLCPKPMMFYFHLFPDRPLTLQAFIPVRQRYKKF